MNRKQLGVNLRSVLRPALVAALVILSSAPAGAQTGESVGRRWSVTATEPVGGDSITAIRSAALGPDGHLVIAGTAMVKPLRKGALTFGGTAAQPFLAKLSPAARLQWVRPVAPPAWKLRPEGVTAMTVTSSGETIVAGRFWIAEQAGAWHDHGLAKFTPKGKLLWARPAPSDKGLTSLSFWMTNSEPMDVLLIAGEEIIVAGCDRAGWVSAFVAIWAGHGRHTRRGDQWTSGAALPARSSHEGGPGR